MVWLRLKYVSCDLSFLKSGRVSRSREGLWGLGCRLFVKAAGIVDLSIVCPGSLEENFPIAIFGFPGSREKGERSFPGSVMFQLFHLTT